MAFCIDLLVVRHSIEDVEDVSYPCFRPPLYVTFRVLWRGLKLGIRTSYITEQPLHPATETFCGMCGALFHLGEPCRRDPIRWEVGDLCLTVFHATGKRRSWQMAYAIYQLYLPLAKFAYGVDDW